MAKHLIIMALWALDQGSTLAQDRGAILGILTMKLLSKIPPFLRNKYLLSAIGFAVWILFFDNRDFITSHFREKGELLKLEQSKKYYEQQISATKQELEQLKTNPALLEKYAREKYLMKRDNEDLFVIRELPASDKH